MSGSDTEDEGGVVLGAEKECEVNPVSVETKRSNEIKLIEKSIVHRICSGQVIVTLSTAVKELVENSIDAGATSIEIRLIDHGSKLIEVIDNGVGISETNFEGLALKHHTSKLTDFTDLSSIATFGFRGEAISSLCALAKLTVTTKTNDSKQAFRIEFDSRGKLISKSPCARQCGTTVVLQDLFSPLPVRHKEFLKNVKREYNKMVNVMYGYCLINSSVRLTCTNQVGQSSQSKVLSVPAHQSLRERIISLFGSKQLTSLIDITQPETLEPSILAEYGLTEMTTSREMRIQLEGLISKPHCGRNSTDRQYFFINSRPCEPTKISRLVNQIYHGFGRTHYPFICLHIKTKQDNVDVNVTPDKRMVYLQNEKIVYATIKATLQSIFTSASSTFDTSTLSQSQFPNSQSSTCETDTSYSDSPSSSQEFDESTKKSQINQGRNRVSSFISKDGSQFDPQFSGDGASRENKKQNIRSILQRFVPGNINNTRNEPSGSKNSSPVLSQPYKRPRQISTGSLATKQPRLADFMKSRGVNFSTTSTSLCTRDEVKISSDEDDDITIIPSPRAGSQSSRNMNETIVTEDCVMLSPEKLPNSDTQYANSNADNEGNDIFEESDSCFFSQNSITSSVMNSSSQESENSNNVIIYDDELEDSGNNYPVHKSVTVKVDWNNIKDRARRRRKEELIVKKENQFSGRFRAKISLGDNLTAEKELKKELTKDMFTQMKIIGQFNLGFIIVKHGSDMFIIDQHASDEKYNFEMLQATTVLQSQRLISPIFLQLPAVSENILMDNIAVFQKNGFEFEINSNAEPTQRVNLTRIPYSKNYEFGKQDVDELIYMLQDAPEKCFYRPSNVRLMFASRACRKSVMIGTNLNLKAMTDIVHHMGQIEQPWNCPHGRPTLRHLFNLNLLPDLDLEINRNIPNAEDDSDE